MINKRIYYFKFFAVGLLLLLISACSTTNNNFLHRGFHNMCARYNGYYYSNENIKEMQKKIAKTTKDDFSKLLPLFQYTDNVTAKNYYADCDKSIKKSSLVIKHHTITDKKTKKEIPNACKWIDDNYMLIGKSYFYKRELFSALESFEYVSKIYPNPEAKYNGMLWMIRTNNEIGSFSLSEATIDEIRNAKDFPNDRSYQQELAAVTADFYIKREEYSPAIRNLLKAITLTRQKTIKARYTYILAQLFEKQGDPKKAAQYYAMVPSLHPSYDMAFSAQINRAKLFDINSPEGKGIKKQLTKMLRDDKNYEYRDQIYYALAEIARKENNIPVALGYLTKSIQVSTNNNTQKALAYLKRADIYFEKPDYTSAQANYDSTMNFLPKDYVDYQLINDKKKNLTELVVNLKVISMEDSLQRLGHMSKEDRNNSIDKMITRLEEEEKKQAEDQLNKEQFKSLIPAPSTDANANTAAWYFYNPTTVSFGVNEFTKKWGSRKLEDNWRRSDKDIVLAESTKETPEVDTLQGKKELKELGSKTKNKKDRDYYLKNVPFTPDAFAKSDLKIVDAYYNVGSIYKEQLQNNGKSIEAFEELLKRFPENKYKLSSYYQLYRTYLAMNDEAKSDYYKNLLLHDYPDSEYAQIIKNPDIGKDIMASKSEVEKFYTETYQMYADTNYLGALANCRKADSTYSKSALMPKFSFLKALCIGRTEDINSFEKALTDVIIKFPKDPIKNKAQEMIDMIKKQKDPKAVTVADTTNINKSKTKFIFKEDGNYYCIITVQNGKGDLDKFKTKVSDFNSESFSLADLNISSIFLDLTHQMVNIKTFEGKQKAMNYYNALIAKKDIFSDLPPGTFQSFVISEENYIIFYKDKNITDYQQFFTKNY